LIPRYALIVKNHVIENFHLPNPVGRTTFKLNLCTMKTKPLLLTCLLMATMVTTTFSQSLTQQIAEAEKVAIQNEAPEENAKNYAQTLGEAFGPDSDSAALIARAEQLAQQSPDQAAAIAAAAAVFVPNLAPRIAAVIASAVPAAAPAVALGHRTARATALAHVAGPLGAGPGAGSGGQGSAVPPVDGGRPVAAP
jgi:hypothetical protein